MDYVVEALIYQDTKYLRNITDPDYISDDEVIDLMLMDTEGYIQDAPCLESILREYLITRLMKINDEVDSWDLLEFIKGVREDNKKRIFSDTEFVGIVIIGMTMNFSDDLYEEVKKYLGYFVPEGTKHYREETEFNV